MQNKKYQYIAISGAIIWSLLLISLIICLLDVMRPYCYGDPEPDSFKNNGGIFWVFFFLYMCTIIWGIVACIYSKSPKVVVLLSISMFVILGGLMTCAAMWQVCIGT